MFESRLSHRLLTLLAIAALAIAAPACSGSGTTDNGDGGDPTADGATSGGGSGATGDASGTPDPSDDADPGGTSDDAGPVDQDAGPVDQDAGTFTPNPDTTTCTLDCGDKACGDDGCGGSCGTCGEDETCNDAGACEAGACVPDCDNKDCGPDGCGNQCGACGSDEQCNDAGQCMETTGDPCDPNPCVAPPADDCEDNTPILYDETGTCTVNGDSYSCTYGFSPGDACGAGTTCWAGACVEVPEGSPFTGDASLITELIVAAADEPETCCFDFDGDGEIDNGVGSLLGLLGGLMADLDVDGSIASSIENGDIAIILEAAGLDDLVDDTAVSVNGYVGYINEDGELLVQPSSYDEDGDPTVSFENGTVSGGIADFGPDDFEAAVPVGGIAIALNVKQARATAAVSAGDEGNFDIADGKLGGLIPFADLVDTINTVAASCDCLGLNGADMFDLTAEDTMACSSALEAASPSCTDADGSLCDGLGGAAENALLCMGVGLVKPDIDTDVTGKGDHFSIGMRFTGEATTIDGVGEDQSPSGCTDCTGGGGPLNGLAHLVLFAMAFALVTRRREA